MGVQVSVIASSSECLNLCVYESEDRGSLQVCLWVCLYERVILAECVPLSARASEGVRASEYIHHWE